MEFTPNAPTAEQCTSNEQVFETEQHIGYAIWYPQMGGYFGKAVVVVARDSAPDDCFNVYVWHTGEFAFGDGGTPVRIHHCNAAQFIEFGETVMAMQSP